MTDDMATPHLGDKVRLIKEGVVGDLKVDGECTVVLIGGYRYELRDKRYAVEILERADDPSRDEVGTVAELNGEVYVKTHDRGWFEVGGSGKAFYENESMAGRRVTGAVPGTPAATAQEVEAQQRLLRPEWRSKPNPGPLVVQYGAPEPDRHKVFSGPNGVRVWWRRDHLWETGDGGLHEWNALSYARFPLTEVIEP